MDIQELNRLLDNVDIYYYESGANYDSDYEDFTERQIALLEQEHQFSHIEF